MGSVVADPALAGVVAGLTKLAEDHPYLKPTGTEYAPHPLLYWVRRCREFALAKKTQEAESCLERVTDSLEYELAQIRDAFRRFDHDDSKHLDTNEFKLMCAYIGWGTEEASVMDLDKDEKISLEEFERFVGHMGGLQQLFQHRRQRVARKQWGVDAPSIIEVGARVQAYHYTENNEKSKSLREAQVLELNVMPSNGVRLVFGFGEGRDARQERQVVPPNWIFSDTHDSDVVAALREVGILEEQQGFWASIFPESEMRAVQRLTTCQRAALANVRSNASLNHEKAMPEVRDRFARLGYGEDELQGVLGWIQDLAPMCIHIHIDDVGRFLETDEFYRSQFETGTSCGALDDKNMIRKGWETDLFGGAYDEAKPFERCKYGALGVMNDYRGITSAYQYGDSYLVLKDVRLRATFASTDSGGIEGQRLAVLDKYAHVLKEYNDTEIHRLVEVAMANTSLEDVPRMQPRLLRGLTADTTNDWVTMGFPDLPQKKGRYFFEVELHNGCESPQIGMLSNQFALAPRTRGQHLLGVGDDKYGWAADGQHSILWHAGQKYAWNRTWKSSGRQLKEMVVVGIAVDIEACKIWFATNGVWDEEAEPSFGPSMIPRGTALYPAISFKGRAAFNFGPEFKHKAPEFKGKSFLAWPGMPDGRLRADCPIIGNSNHVSIYKEIQIHGEVSLKRNVQRLVANRKHLEVSKSDRSWAVCVDGLGSADGSYDRVGAKNGKAMYKQHDGDSHQIFFDRNTENWKIIHEERPDIWLAEAPPVAGSFEPPRHQWSVPTTKRGRVPVGLFKQVCANANVSSEVQEHIISVLGKGASGSEQEIFRIDDHTTFEDEWTKLQKENKVQMTAEDFWILCVQKKHEILSGKRMKDAVIVETPHPYPAKTHSWTRDVSLPNATKLRVTFDPRSVTLDDCTTFKALAGGLSKSLAGVGARAHLRAISGTDQVHGTMAGQAEGGKWIVNIDNDETEICGCFREWMDAAEGRHCTATCAQEKKVIRVKYDQTVGEEISGFTFNEACPLSPFSIAGFTTPGGPAQLKGVFTGWFVDVIHLIKQKAFKDLTGEDLGEVPMNLTQIAENIEGFKKRLEALRDVKNITLVFYNGLDFQLLPSCAVSYKAKRVSDEILALASSGGVLSIADMTEKGPARDAGVRTGWHVSLHETFSRRENKDLLHHLTPQKVLEDPELIRTIPNLTLMLEPANAEPQEFFCGKERSWSSFVMPSNTAQFVFQSDGDGGDSPDERWGVFAVVTNAEEPPPAESLIQELQSAYEEANTSMVGFSSKGVSVEPEDWDEARLRALCERHGWEFEWMTEDGERQRRIEGASRARQVVAEKVESNEKVSSQPAAWWRLDSMARAFSFNNGDQRQVKRKIEPPPQIKKS